MSESHKSSQRIEIEALHMGAACFVSRFSCCIVWTLSHRTAQCLLHDRDATGPEVQHERLDGLHLDEGQVVMQGLPSGANG